MYKLTFFSICLVLFPEEYARKVTARMVSIIQKEQITGKSMPVRTFEQEIK